MRIYSREVLVGFLLVLAVAVVGCQPVQPVSDIVATATSEALVESEVITDTATLSATVSGSASISVAESVVISASVTVTPTQEASAGADPAMLAAGLAVYRAQYCGVCHTLDAAETRGTFGPPHNGMGAIAAGHLAYGSYSGAATTPAEYIHESIVEPQVYIVPGYATTSHRMPSYAHLDAASLDALVVFLLAQ